MEPKDFVGKTVEVKFNRANCPNATTCNILSCDKFSPTGYIGIVTGIDIDTNIGETTFSLDDYSIRWACRCVLFEEEKISMVSKTILSCPRCNGELIKKIAQEPFTGKDYTIDKCKDCGWC
jgi:hypothetical protein